VASWSSLAVAELAWRISPADTLRRPAGACRSTRPLPNAADIQPCPPASAAVRHYSNVADAAQVSCEHFAQITTLQLLFTANESVPVQLAQCWFPGLAISNAKI